MNHKYWISVVLNEEIEDEKIMTLIDLSFNITNENKDDIPLELIVKVININHPDNENFLEQCE